MLRIWFFYVFQLHDVVWFRPHLIVGNCVSMLLLHFADNSIKGIIRHIKFLSMKIQKPNIKDLMKGFMRLYDLP